MVKRQEDGLVGVFLAESQTLLHSACLDIPSQTLITLNKHFQSFLIPLQNLWTANHKLQKDLHLRMVLHYCEQVKSFQEE